MGSCDNAMAKFEKAVQVIKESNLKNEVKDNFKRFYLYNAGCVTSMKRDLVTAKAKSEEFRKQAKAMNNLNSILSPISRIALEEKDYNKAIEELQQTNQQNPYNLYRLALAYKYKSD